MSNAEKKIYVYSDWVKENPVLVGLLFENSNRGKEIYSFEYDNAWLAGNSNFTSFDPDLSLYSGRQYAPLDKTLFGIFSDSCPDRWGRLLMKRREAITARKENRKPRALTESDFLLGVHDESRMGALRFSLQESGPFLSFEKEFSTPPWTTLRNLECASLAFESGEDNLDEEKWLKQLLAPGSSLGGARPKASVHAPDGSLWIAKFPSKHDEWDSGAWEMVVHELARKCDLNVPQAKLEAFSENGSTYLVKRFDRDGARRIHYASAMTLLGKTDGAGSDGASYLDIVSFIKSNGASPKRDLKELWKRVVFSMAVSNTDDHLRNHGFVLSESGWHLSPMFDVNPSIYGDKLSLSVSSNDSSIDYELAMETAEYYEIDAVTAKAMVEEIKEIVKSNWRVIAVSNDLSRNAIERMEPAFSL